MKSNYNSTSKFQTMSNKPKKTFADQYFSKIKNDKSNIGNNSNSKYLNSQYQIKKILTRTQNSQNSKNSQHSKNSYNSKDSQKKNSLNKVQHKSKNSFTNRFKFTQQTKKIKVEQPCRTNSISSKSVNSKIQNLITSKLIAKKFCEQESVTQSSHTNTNQQLPTSLRPQPIELLFLCINCYEYFLYPEKQAHVNHCKFQGTQQQTIYKIKRLRQMLEIISVKYPNPYTKALSKKIDKYLKNEISLQDILILEWFIINSKVEVGLVWKQLFWVLQKLGKMKQGIQQNEKNGNLFWILCK